MLKIVENLWAVGALPGGARSAPPDPLAGGEGVAAPSQRTPYPCSRSSALQSRPNEKSWTRPWMDRKKKERKG